MRMIDFENIFRILFIKVVLLSFIFLTTSCVGKLEDKNLDTTVSTEGKKLQINFTGIEQAKAISHNKAEISFFPASGSDDLTYLIYRDGLTNPVTFLDSSLVADHRGLYKVVVSDLSSDTTYNFEVQAKDNKTGATSHSSKLISTKTYTKVACDFFGVSGAVLPAGPDSVSSIIVSWPEATTIGNPTSKFDGDPYQYVITLLDTNLLTANEMNVDSLSESDGRYKFFASGGNSKVIFGLQPNTKYLVQVRCEHVSYIDNLGDLSYVPESNTKYTSIKTSSGELGDLDFDANSLQLRLNDGDLGKQSFIANWEGASGTFDHYRLYYSTNQLNTISLDPVCSYDSGSETYCLKIGTDKIISTVSGLVQDSNYNAQLIVCLNSACSLKASSVERGISMTPVVANFQGINNIRHATSINNVDEVTIEFNLPDFTTGIADGLIVEYVDSGISKILNDPSIANSSGLTVLYSDFDISTDTKLVVKGINPYLSTPYCFNIYPYINGNDGKPKYTLSPDPSVTQFCLNTNSSTNVHLEMPDDIGISGCAPTSYSVRVDFEIPLEGVYSFFEVFWKKGSSASFDLSLAFAGNGSYGSILVDPEQTFIELVPLLSSTEYTFAVVGYYLGADGNIYRTGLNSTTIKGCTTL